MAFRQLASHGFVTALFVAAALSCATAIDIASPDGGLAGRKFLLEEFGSKPLNPPAQDNPPLEVLNEKDTCGKAPCRHPLPAPVDNGDTVVFLEGNNAFEEIVPGGTNPPIAIPPCQVGVCDQALVEERDLDARHIDQHVDFDYIKPGPNPPSPNRDDSPQLAAWSMKKEACLAHHKCLDPMKLCLNGLCVYPSHVNKALADERDIGERHINKVDYPQPVAWSMYDAVPCLAQCPNPMQVCFNGFCVGPPHVDSVNKGFNRGGAVIP